MADQGTQSYANHRRYHPMWHFFAVPILMAHILIATYHAWRFPTRWNLWTVVFAVGVFLAVAAARTQALRVQDRVIRLEMRLRLRDILPAALAARVMELSTGQLVGLRFAADAELPGLVERCLKGELKDREAIKKEIKDWQPDFLRA